MRPVPTWIDHRVEQEVNDVFIQEIEKAINNWNNWKAPRTDGISAELIKYGGEILHQGIYYLCQKILKDDELPKDRNKAIVIPLHKKDDKLNCKNYRGILLLNMSHKIFSRILLGIL